MTLGGAIVVGAAAAISSDKGKEVVANALVEFIKKLSSPATKALIGFTDRAVVTLQIGFQSYLITSYNKCSIFKSILPSGSPLYVADRYVNITVKSGDKEMSDGVMIANLNRLKRVVITGLAGSGKSMLMKYITVLKFENPDGSIPLFVDLRDLNKLTERSLLPFIRSTCTTKSSEVTEDQFDLALRAGAFSLILDGFDEIDPEYRAEIQAQILGLYKDYPNLCVVVSSRPDDERFRSWVSFHEYSVEPMTPAQTEELIGKFEYDPKLKKRFLSACKDSLFKTHSSFLQSPLLTSIMLLTFEAFAKIPNRMHEFYQKAFETLLQKHDASKEQYQRKMVSNLSQEDFRSAFSAFCAFSYLDRKFSFKQDELKLITGKAIKYVENTEPSFPRSVSTEKFLVDVKDAVCMIQPDGLEMAFVHRSFQEYFAALFATKLRGDKLIRLLNAYSSRWSDSAIPMALDMLREPIEQDWVLPTIDRIVSDLSSRSYSVGEQMAYIYSGYYAGYSDGRLITGPSTPFTDVIRILASLTNIYPGKINFWRVTVQVDLIDPDGIMKKILPAGNKRLSGYDKWKEMAEGPGDDGILEHNFRLNENADWWLIALGVDVQIRTLVKGLRAVRAEIVGREAGGSSLLDEYV